MLMPCVPIQGVDPANTDKVQSLILDKLREMAETGFTPGAIEAAVNTIEFSLRENNTGSFPRGLSLMLRAVGAWIYDRDPYTPIQVRKIFGSSLATAICMFLARFAGFQTAPKTRMVFILGMCSICCNRGVRSLSSW